MKFWRNINPVLPLVYDDSLSYYEVLCKLIKAVNGISEEIDNNLEEYIKDALPDLIADVTYNAETDTLEFTFIDDTGEASTSTDPIKRIAVNGISRPVVDEDARRWEAASWLHGKRICMYGDSTLVVPETYATKIRDAGICAAVTIRGVSGNSLVYQGYDIISEATDLATFDYVFVCYGINDWSGISRKVFCDYIRQTAQAIINAGSEPVFVLPWTVYIPTLASNGFINNFGCDMAGYVDGAIDECERLHLKYFNLCGISGVNASNYRTKLNASSNGSYLHEGNALGSYIAAAILAGAYNTGKNKTGYFSGRPFNLFLPLDFSALTYTEMRTITQNTTVTQRKGRALSFRSGGVRSCASVNSGQFVRVTGFCAHSESSGYVTFGYVSEYDQTHEFVPVCQLRNGADFDFTFEPPAGGAAWRPAFECSEGSAVINDLTLYSNEGEVRLVGSDPAVPGAIPITVNSSFNVTMPGYALLGKDRVTLTPFGVTAAENLSDGVNIQVAELGFYPEHTFYGSCHIGSRVQTYLIDATGKLMLYNNEAAIPSGTHMFFDGNDITPTPFINI